jgi:site-specific DNA recombinase
MPKKPRGAIYRRVSGPDDVRLVSLDDQTSHCVQALQKEGIKDYDVYTDNFSGAYLYERPELARLREAYKAGRYSAVAVYSIDRLSRKQGHQALLFEEIEQLGVRLISATEDLDDSPEGQLLRNIRGYVAEVERLKIMERTGGAKKRLRAAGKIIPQGKARLGYTYDAEERTRVVVPEEAAVVQRIFKLASEGNSAQRIAILLNEDDTPTPGEFKGRKRIKLTGKAKWRHDVVLDILRDQSYTGKPMVQGKSRLEGKIKSNGHRPQVANPLADHQPTDTESPVIIETKLWTDANTKVSEGVTTTRNLTRPRLLRGRITCGVCGLPMTICGSYGGKRGDKIYYGCSSKFKAYQKDGALTKCPNGVTPADWADDEVWQRLRHMLINFWDFEPQLREQWESQQGADLTPDRLIHESALKEAEAAIGRLVGNFGSATDQAVMNALKGEVERLTLVAAKHRECLHEIDSHQSGLIPWETVLEALGWLREQRQKLIDHEPPFEIRRKIVEIANIKVIAKGRDLEVQGMVIPVGSTSSSHGNYKLVIPLPPLLSLRVAL